MSEEPVTVESFSIGDKSERFSHMPLKERAVCDYSAFIDLTEFRGGTKNFSAVHTDMINFLTQPHRKTNVWNKGDMESDLDKGNRRRMILVARGHLKSTLCSVGYVLWRIYRNPNIRICVATATKELALQFVREIKQYLEDDQLQETIWNNRPHIKGRLIPVLDKAGAKRRDQKRMQNEDLDYTEAEDKKIVWRSDAIQVLRSRIAKEPTVIAASPGSNITGMHFDLVLMDDIINDDTTATADKIAKTLDWAMDLESVLDPVEVTFLGHSGGNRPGGFAQGALPGKRNFFDIIGDEIVILGTRYAKGDYYEYIESNLQPLRYVLFARNVYKNGVDSSDGYTYPEKFNDERVADLKARLTPKRFASQYLNKILADEDIVLRKSLIRWLDHSWMEVNRNEVIIKFPPSATGDVVTRSVRIVPVLFIDPAISQKKRADNTVIMVGGVSADRDLIILDYRYGKLLPFDIVRNMYELADLYQLSACHVEVVAFQQVLSYLIKQSFNKFRPIVVKEYRPKGEKKGRIKAMLEPYFKNSKVWLMKHMSANTKFMEEIEYFPQENVSDDFIDTMAMIAEVCVPTVAHARPVRLPPRFGNNAKYGGTR